MARGTAVTLMPSLDRAAIDPDADRVVRKLTRAGYKAYLVGGCVRDLLVGRTPKDFDVATSATPNEIKATFRNSRIIGRRFRLAHVFFGSKIIETSTFRANPRDEDDHDLLIRRDNVFGTETEDARRRDFTINGLFYDVEREEVIDHVGGLADLDAKLIRTIGDPDIRFQEDPVRMLRAIKFAARLDFGFEPATWRALLRWRSEISKCAPPRLLEEIHRLLRGGAARRSFELLVETGVLAMLSPYLAGPARGPRRADDRAAGSPPTACPARRSPRVEYDDEDPAEHDIDDPDEEPDDTAPPTRPRPRRRARHEERSGTACGPTSRSPAPSVAAPVRLSFLPSGAELAAAPRAGLGDARRHRQGRRGRPRSVECGRVRCAARAVRVRRRAARRRAPRRDPGGRHPLIVQLHVTRRDSERLRYLLLAQSKLQAARRRAARPSSPAAAT